MFRKNDVRIIITSSIFLCILLFSFGVDGREISCVKNPIYCQIKSLAPRLSSSTAMKLSNMFHHGARTYKIKDVARSVAIAMQETSFNVNLSRKQNVIVFNDDITEWKVVRGYSDICMFQFHVNTIVHEKINPIKLKTDIGYCVAQHFKLMKKKLKLCKHLGDEAWTCYHSRTPKFRKRYKEDVERYY